MSLPHGKLLLALLVCFDSALFLIFLIYFAIATTPVPTPATEATEHASPESSAATPASPGIPASPDTSIPEVRIHLPPERIRILLSEVGDLWSEAASTIVKSSGYVGDSLYTTNMEVVQKVLVKLREQVKDMLKSLAEGQRVLTMEKKEAFISKLSGRD